MISDMSRHRAILTSIACIFIGGLSFFILIKWFNLASAASTLGFIMGFYTFIIIVVSEIKKWPWLVNRKLSPLEAKNAILAFRLMVFPFLCFMTLTVFIFQNGNGIGEAIMSYLSILTGGYGLLILLTLFLNGQKFR